MSHTILRPFIVKVSVLGYFPLYNGYSKSNRGEWGNLSRRVTRTTSNINIKFIVFHKKM